MTAPDAHDRRPSAGRGRSSVALPLTAVLVGVVVALVAQFAMDSLADSSDLGHWAQHALLFWSGIVIGLGLYGLYQRAQARP